MMAVIQRITAYCACVEGRVINRIPINLDSRRRE